MVGCWQLARLSEGGGGSPLQVECCCVAGLTGSLSCQYEEGHEKQDYMSYGHLFCQTDTGPKKRTLVEVILIPGWQPAFILNLALYH